MTQNNRGRFVWHELITSDVAGAKKFYGELLGWKARPFADGAPGYELWHLGDVAVGGLMPISPEMKKGGFSPRWMGHVCVDDVDATAKKAASLGARVHEPPTDIPGVGRFSVFTDPQDALIAAYTPSKNDPTLPEEMAEGHIVWNELATTSWEKALDFYSQLFGWEKDTSMDMGEDGIYQLYKAPGMKDAMGGMFNRPKEMERSTFVYYVMVAEIDATLAQVKSLGGKVLSGPLEIPGDMRILQCLDPQGAAIAFLGK